MNRSIVEKVMHDANRDKRFFRALVRLKKNGRFARVVGKVYHIGTNKKTGEEYAVIKNFDPRNPYPTHQWQTVVLNRILQIKKDGYRYINELS